MKLNRTKQCQNCPWKVDTDPYEIPHGYDVEKHRALSCTIARNGDLRGSNGRAMACHHSEVGKEEHCIGWLVNQLGVGNNIGLRLQMMHCENAKDIEVYGEQHERFEDTLPD